MTKVSDCLIVQRYFWNEHIIALSSLVKFEGMKAVPNLWLLIRLLGSMKCAPGPIFWIISSAKALVHAWISLLSKMKSIFSVSFPKLIVYNFSFEHKSVRLDLIVIVKGKDVGREGSSRILKMLCSTQISVLYWKLLVRW